MVESTKKSDDELDIREFAPEKSPISTEAVDASELIAQIEAEVQRAIRDAGGDDSKLVADLKTLQREAGSAKSSRDLSNVRQSLFLQTMNTRSDAAKVRTEEAVKETQGDGFADEDSGRISDKNRSFFYSQMMQNRSYSQGQQDFLLSMMDNELVKRDEANFNKNSKEANEVTKTLALANEKEFLDLKRMAGETWGVREEAFASMLERNPQSYSDPRFGKWMKELQRGDVSDESYAEMRGVATSKLLDWETRRNTFIDKLAETSPQEAKYAKEHADSLWSVYKDNQALYESKEFKDKHAQLRANPKLFDTLSEPEKLQMAAFDVIAPTSLSGLTNAIGERAKEVDDIAKSLESTKGEGLTGDNKRIYDSLNGVTDPHKRQEILVSLAIKMDAKLLQMSSGENSALFEKAREAYVSAFVDIKSSEVVQGIQKSTIKAVAQSEEVSNALEMRYEYEKTHKVNHVELDKKSFFKKVDQMIKEEEQVADQQRANKETVRYPYSATLREIAGYEVYSKRTIKLLEQIENKEIDGDAAYKQWEKIKDVDYDASAQKAIKNVTKELQGKYPELVARLKSMDFEKQVDPLIARLNTDSKYADHARELADELTGKTKKWNQFTAEEQTTLVAYMTKNPVHMASDTLCTYGPGGVCHAPGLDKKANQITGPNKTDSKNIKDEPHPVFGANLYPAFGAYNIPNVNTQKPAAEPTFDAALKQVKPDAVTKSVFDLNHDQKLDINEVRKVMGQMGIKLDNFDKNHDHQLTAPELTAAMQAAVQQANSGKKPGKTP